LNAKENLSIYLQGVYFMDTPTHAQTTLQTLRAVHTRARIMRVPPAITNQVGSPIAGHRAVNRAID
jgi:hypothetical protein